MDNDEIVALLTIASGCAEHGGKLSAISGIAMTRLLEINEALRNESIEAAKAARKAEAMEAVKTKIMAEHEAAKVDANDPTPVRRSKTDETAIDNMRRV